MSLKFTEKLCVMTMKNDTKIEEELTCHFKIDMRNLTNFDPTTSKSKKFEEKLTCGLKNDMKNLAYFHQST